MKNLIDRADIQKIADEGSKAYLEVKSKFDPEHKGKFLAIESESKSFYLGNTSAEALEKARMKHPEKIFYVVKIGFDSAETMANFYVHNDVR